MMHCCHNIIEYMNEFLGFTSLDYTSSLKVMGKIKLFLYIL